jgi:hypothetical protein
VSDDDESPPGHDPFRTEDSSDDDAVEVTARRNSRDAEIRANRRRGAFSSSDPPDRGMK